MAYPLHRRLDLITPLRNLQSKMLLGDNNGVTKNNGRRRATMADHKTLEKYLGRYSGLILYLKEMDEAVYAKLCAVCASIFCLCLLSPTRSSD